MQLIAFLAISYCSHNLIPKEAGRGGIDRKRERTESEKTTSPYSHTWRRNSQFHYRSKFRVSFNVESPPSLKDYRPEGLNSITICLFTRIALPSLRELEQKRQALGENWRFVHMENLPLTKLLKARKLIEQLESFNTSPEFCKYVEEIEATLDRAISLVESPFGEGSTNVDPVTNQHKRESSKRR